MRHNREVLCRLTHQGELFEVPKAAECWEQFVGRPQFDQAVLDSFTAYEDLTSLVGWPSLV